MEPRYWAAVAALLPLGFLLASLRKTPPSKRWANLCLGLGLLTPVYVERIYWAGGPVFLAFGIVRMALAALGLMAGLSAAMLHRDRGAGWKKITLGLLLCLGLGLLGYSEIDRGRNTSNEITRYARARTPGLR